MDWGGGEGEVERLDRAWAVARREGFLLGTGGAGLRDIAVVIEREDVVDDGGEG